MENMSMDNTRRGRSSGAIGSWPVVVVMAVLLLIILALSSALVHRSFNAMDEPRGNVKLSLRLRYPGSFRFPEEQEAFEKLRRVVQNVTSFITIPGYNETTQCNLKSPPFPINPSEVIEYHACCKSKGRHVSKEYWVDYLGINRTMAVYTDPVTGRVAKQFFYTEKCEEVNHCLYSCQCGQRDYYVTGVYVLGSEDAVSWFSLPGCCKCRNR